MQRFLELLQADHCCLYPNLEVARVCVCACVSERELRSQSLRVHTHGYQQAGLSPQVQGGDRSKVKAASSSGQGIKSQ